MIKKRFLQSLVPLILSFGLAWNGVLAAENSGSSNSEMRIESISTKLIKLDGPIKVRIINVEKADDLGKLRLWLGHYETKTKPVLTAPNEVTFQWDSSPEAQSHIKDTWKKLLIEGNRLGKPKVKVGLRYGDKLLLPATELTNPEDLMVELWMYNENIFYWWIVFLIVSIVLFLWLARTSDIIRDSAPPSPPANSRKPYSLGKLQMAIWFFIVIGSFIWLWAITADIPAISKSALILIGLSLGTGALAVVVDTSKRQSMDSELAALVPERDKLAATVTELGKIAKLTADAAQKEAVRIDIKAKITFLQAKVDAAPPENANDVNELNQFRMNLANLETELEQIRTRISELAPGGNTAGTDELSKLSIIRIQLAEKKAQLEQKEKQIASALSAQTKPVSKGLVKDILTDMNGISFHRFQMLLWTLVLSAVFLQKVWTTFAMPDFDELLLALMGISGATYVGFKVPERQT